MKKTDTKLPADWRGKTMTSVRQLIKQADPEISEEVKYRTRTNPDGVFVWYRDGMICTGETYKQHLRLGFSQGVILKEQDPKGLINAYRAMIIKEGDQLNQAAFKKLIKAAVSLNQAKKKTKKQQRNNAEK